MVLLFTKTGSELIKRGSLIGNHEISVYHDANIAEDSGGIFASVKKTIAGFNGGKVKLKY